MDAVGSEGLLILGVCRLKPTLAGNEKERVVVVEKGF
jgi:hypothetical protein